MARALVEEFCRISGLELKPEFFRRCQREFRDTILPLYDEVEALRDENAALKAAHADREAKKPAKAS